MNDAYVDSHCRSAAIVLGIGDAKPVWSARMVAKERFARRQVHEGGEVFCAK